MIKEEFANKIITDKTTTSTVIDNRLPYMCPYCFSSDTFYYDATNTCVCNDCLSEF
jgi:hypothetical protein